MWVCSCPRARAWRRGGRAPVRARGEASPAGRGGFDWRRGGVACERLLRSPACRVRITPAARGGWPHTPWEAGGAGRVRAERPGRGGVGPSPPPPVPGRVGEAGVGCPPAPGGPGEEKRNFPALPSWFPGCSRRREVSSSRAAAADAMLGSVRNGALPGLSPLAGAGPRAPGARCAARRTPQPLLSGSGPARRVRGSAGLVRGAEAGRTRGGSPEVGLAVGLQDSGPSRGLGVLGPQHLSVQKFADWPQGRCNLNSIFLYELG